MQSSSGVELVRRQLIAAGPHFKIRLGHNEMVVLLLDAYRAASGKKCLAGFHEKKINQKNIYFYLHRMMIGALGALQRNLTAPQ